MATIKAPFNFIPLSDKVFFPDWADEISQDIPFEDGVSGTIELKIKAETPIFVRNGHTQNDAEEKNERYKSFSKTEDNRYFIPATTMKGCIRSVLEIMSFGKMTQVEDASFGLRDLQKSTYTSTMRKVRCGWLYIDEDGYTLEDHGTPKRVPIKEVDAVLGKGGKLQKFITDNDFSDENDKLARKKYEIIYEIINPNINLSEKSGYNDFVNSNDYLLSNDKGTFVLTGQSSKRYFDPNATKPKAGKDGVTIGMWKGKGKEFLFPKQTIKKLKVPDEVIRAFESIHVNSIDYIEFWKIKLYKGQKIPVFFVLQDNQIHSLGLTGLYKYPFRHTVFDAIPDELKNPKEKDRVKLDLAESIFGYTLMDNALRGRVLFGHAFAIGQPDALDDKVFVSATPHPSYYPLYVEGGSDWNNARRIAGRKRYPVRNQVNYNNEGTANMEQICTMLKKGAVFKERIAFHNLKPIELGALLSAITFHGMNDSCYHNLGYGKAYGYGKVKVSDVKLGFVKESIDYYMLEFEKAMGAFMESVEDKRNVNGQPSGLEKDVKNNKWLCSEQIQELVAMASGIPANKERQFEYMKMSTNRNDNEFLQVKRNRESLKRYSRIIDKQITVESVEKRSVPCDNSDGVAPVKEEIVVLRPTDLKCGEIVNAICIKPKVVRIEGYEYDIQLVLPKTMNADKLVQKNLDVRIKQISKAGKICQVEYMELS